MPRAILLRAADNLHRKEGDPVIARCLGMILSGALILAWVGLKLTPKSIGA